MLARFKICSNIIKDFEGSTSGIHTLLKAQYNLNLFETKSISRQSNVTKPNISQIADFLNRKTDYFDEVLSRKTALDGLPFGVSYTLIEKVIKCKRVKNIPKSVHIVRTAINYSNSVRNSLKKRIERIKMKRSKFSLIFDE